MHKEPTESMHRTDTKESQTYTQFEAVENFLYSGSALSATMADNLLERDTKVEK